jgi:hypothetical protein
MKTNTKTLVIALLGITTIFGCQKEDIRPMDVSDKTEMEAPPEKKTLPDQYMFEKNLCNTKWYVALFDDGVPQMKINQTSLFTAYMFEFTPNHVVIAKGRERNIAGKWNSFMVGNERKLVLDFGFKPFIKLNNIWVVDAYTSGSVELKCPKSQGSAVLNFESTASMPK